MSFMKQNDGTVTITYYEFPLPTQTKQVMEQYFGHKMNGMFRVSGSTIYYFERGGAAFVRMVEQHRLQARTMVSININDQSAKKLIWIKERVGWKNVTRLSYNECYKKCNNMSDLTKSLIKTMERYKKDPNIAQEVKVKIQNNQRRVLKQNVFRGDCQYVGNILYHISFSSRFFSLSRCR